MCLSHNSLQQCSSSMKISPDRFSPPDSLWSRELPRWVFVEVWIIASFLLEPALVNDLGDRVFEHINADSNNNHLHLAISGGGSFSDMSSSLLARFDSRELGGKTHPLAAKSVISPRLKRTVTPDTKKLVKEIEASELQSLYPSTRNVDRVSPRGERYFAPITSFSTSEFEEVNDIEGLLKNEILAAIAEKKLVSSYASILASVHQRVWKKSSNIQRSSKSGNGGSILGEYRRSQAMLSIYWKPAIILFCSSSPLDTYADLTREKLTMGNIVELFVLSNVKREEDTISRKSALTFVDVICKCGSGRGAFVGSDKLKHGVLHDILRRQV